MEKVIYAVWRDPSVSREAFNEALRTSMAERLDPMVLGLRLNLQDSAVMDATAPCYASTEPQMEAFVQVWLDSSIDRLRKPVDDLIQRYTSRREAWLVTESAVLRNRIVSCPEGERLPAYNHMAVISIPPRLTKSAWQDLWQNHHTFVAVETQSNFEYLQNPVVRPLTYAAPAYAAFIEESFPSEAAYDEAVFLDAVGDPDKLVAHRERLYSSTFSFVDAGGFDLVPTSQYDMKRISGLQGDSR